MSPYVSPVTGYLVVEGYISGNSPTQFTISRAIPLPGYSVIPMVTGATVQVEGSDNSLYPLDEQGNGVYGDSLTLDATTKYRLRIDTPNGESYLSDFVPFKPTPVIDSINWTNGGASGVIIYATTHDVTNATRYYQWQYTQTWQYHSFEPSGYIYVYSSNEVIPRPSADQNFECWKTAPSTNILVGSSAKLANDMIYEFPIVTIPANTQPLAILYSILVREFSLTDSGYNYLSLMQLNTESLGSVFDVQPSQPLGGNIHCLNNPNQTVIGYISAGTVQTKRIFIDLNQVPGWLYFYSCPLPDRTIPGDPDSLKYYFQYAGYTPIDMPYDDIHTANFNNCIDCTLQGGTTQKPTFWPN